jgi:hypothetical protein
VRRWRIVWEHTYLYMCVCIRTFVCIYALVCEMCYIWNVWNDIIPLHVFMKVHISLILFTAIEPFSLCSIYFNLQGLTIKFHGRVHYTHLKAHSNMFQFDYVRWLFLHVRCTRSVTSLIIHAQSFLRFCTMQTVVAVCCDGAKSKH